MRDRVWGDVADWREPGTRARRTPDRQFLIHRIRGVHRSGPRSTGLLHAHPPCTKTRLAALRIDGEVRFLAWMPSGERLVAAGGGLHLFDCLPGRAGPRATPAGPLRV
jgi:hypothetical protein